MMDGYHTMTEITGDMVSCHNICYRKENVKLEEIVIRSSKRSSPRCNQTREQVKGVKHEGSGKRVQ
jgi:hypothetical protein